jgi:hypothetical protein
MSSLEKLDAQLVGIGQMIKATRFSVPIYQRPYSWTDIEVDELCRDLGDALRSPKEDYFLGTVVTARSTASRMTIIDGQQRLVTVSIIVAAVRDYFVSVGQTERAQEIERDYLFKRELRTMEATPHILLTPEDRDFFTQAVATIPTPPATRTVTPATPAQQRLARATEIATTFVKGLSTTTKTPDDLLVDLVEFLNEYAKVVFVSVASESSAYVIFEVLNDRGLELSITDLLKNFIFRTADDRVAEAQTAWTQMTALMNELATEADLKVFVRHYWSSHHGMTRERDLYAAIRKHVTTKAQAVDLAKALQESAAVYASLGNPSSDVWDELDNVVRESIEVLDQLGVTQLRPLLLAIFNKFEPIEIAKAMPMIVGWTVRFLICGSGGSGTLEAAYSDRAKEVSDVKYKTTADLYAAMAAIVPDDKTFEARFASATVSNANLAKYYLRVIEHQKRATNEDELVVNPSEAVNLEHVLPKTPGADWSHIPVADQKGLLKRIGNLTLLHSKRNNRIGNASFDKKKDVFKNSAVQITREICAYPAWDEAAIAARQAELAKIAVKAWRAKPRS